VGGVYKTKPYFEPFSIGYVLENGSK